MKSEILHTQQQLIVLGMAVSEGQFCRIEHYISVQVCLILLFFLFHSDKPRKTSAQHQFLEYFLVRLRQDIWSPISPHDPKDLMQVMEVVRDIEEAMKQVWRFLSYRRSTRLCFRYKGTTSLYLKQGGIWWQQ